jgi:hypothetical protein
MRLLVDPEASIPRISFRLLVRTMEEVMSAAQEEGSFAK